MLGTILYDICFNVVLLFWCYLYIDPTDRSEYICTFYLQIIFHTYIYISIHTHTRCIASGSSKLCQRCQFNTFVFFRVISG